MTHDRRHARLRRDGPDGLDAYDADGEEPVMTDTTHLNVRAVLNAGHLLLMQNDKAVLRDEDSWAYYNLVAKWCKKAKFKNELVYWDPGMDEGTRH